MIELLLAVIEEQNPIHKYCMDKHDHWTGRAACVQELQHAQRKMEVEDLREFLKANPHYKYPGMALPNGRIKPLDVCWGSSKTYYIGADKVKKEKC